MNYKELLLKNAIKEQCSIKNSSKGLESLYTDCKLVTK